MKKIVLTALLALASTSAFADPGKDAAYKACGRLNQGNLGAQCVAIVAQGNYFDTRAVAACDRINSQNDTVTCITAIRDLSYDSDVAVKTCDQMQSIPATIECLKSVGRTVYQSNCDTNAIRAYLDDALGALSSRQYGRAYQSVNAARNVTLTCGN